MSDTTPFLEQWKKDAKALMDKIEAQSFGAVTKQPQTALDKDDFSSWTTEALLEYERRLYDDGVNGCDTWLLRDEVLWELSSRNDTR